jgi:tetratricopeptide (TPR) repeat protein
MSTIGHFRMVREIGRGGAGVVYLAEDVDIPGRRVALKRLRPEVADAGAEVLRREAAVLASIEHPHILVVHEVGLADDGLFLVTEYMPEGSMAERVRRGPLPVAEALAAARQTASALAAAHELGILHRDVKPGNMLIASDGRVKVSDFGLAVHTVPLASDAGGEATATLTLPTNEGGDGIFGTPLYIPPEALAGAPPSAAGDQFAFGVAFHEMLAGRRPFERTRGIEAVLEAPSIDPKCPSDLARIIGRCLSRDPSARFASMAEVVAALDRAIARRGRDRRRLTWVVAGVAVVALLAVSGWRLSVWHAGREAQRLNEEGRAALEAGNFGDARRLFLASRGADPGYLAACTNLGTLALLDSDPSWALAILGDCATTFGDVDVVVYNHASALRRSGDLKGAEAALRRAADIARGGPLEAAALNELTLVLTVEGRAQEALAIVGPRRPAAADTPEQAILLKSIGLAELAGGSPTAAAATLKTSIAGPLPKGSRVDALVGLGHALAASGNREGAVEAYAEAIASGAEGAAQVEATQGIARGGSPRPPESR